MSGAGSRSLGVVGEGAFGTASRTAVGGFATDALVEADLHDIATRENADRLVMRWDVGGIAEALCGLASLRYSFRV